MRDEIGEEIERLRLEMDWLAAPPQLEQAGIELELIEGENHSAVPR
jgi:hypothetical protein